VYVAEEPVVDRSIKQRGWRLLDVEALGDTTKPYNERMLVVARPWGISSLSRVPRRQDEQQALLVAVKEAAQPALLARLPVGRRK